MKALKQSCKINRWSLTTWTDLNIMTSLQIHQQAAASLDGASSNSTLFLVYDQISALSLEPCASLMTANKSGLASTCAAAAFDKTSGSDLCAMISVQDVSTIPSQSRCLIMCSYEHLTSPSNYHNSYTGLPLTDAFLTDLNSQVHCSVIDAGDLLTWGVHITVYSH